jgi:hypothetical protein
MSDDRRYIVRRKIDRSVMDPQYAPHPADQYTAAFADREAAEEHARRLDRDYKRAEQPVEPNPFRYHRLDELTSLPEFALRDWLQDADIPLPAVAVPPTAKRLRGLTPEQKEEEIEFAQREVWTDWWDKVMVGKALAAEQAERVWEGFNLYTFHEAVEVELVGPPRLQPDRVYAVVHSHWEYGDDWYYGANDATWVYRTREQADDVCRTLNFENRPPENWNGGEYTFVVVELEHNPGG